MNTDVIRAASSLSPPRLTELLRASGALQDGEVQSVQTALLESNAGDQIYRVKASYSASTDAQPPEKMILRVSEDQLAFQTHEAVFYDQIAPEMSAATASAFEQPYITCYHVAYNSPRQQSSFLLADIDQSHTRLEFPMPPTQPQSFSMVDSLSRVHAHWWEHPWLGGQLGDSWDETRIQRLIQRGNRNGLAFLKFAGDRLVPRDREALEQIAAKWPQDRVDHLIERKRWTLVHGDAHPGNFRIPKTADIQPAILTPWESWRVDTGTDDLAFMVAAHWYPALRQAQEKLLLRRYHENLLRLGVENYAWDDCCYDYRASILRVLFFLIGGWRRRRDPVLYWDRLEKSLLAYDDWDCQELL
jgi:hypothetical protein